MNKFKAVADLLIMAYMLFYLGLSIADHNYIVAILCGLVSILAYNHLVRMSNPSDDQRR